MEDKSSLQRDLELGDEETSISNDNVLAKPVGKIGVEKSSKKSANDQCAGRAQSELRHQAVPLLMGDLHADSHDEELLSRSVADAGRWAFGTIVVEVWLLTKDKLQLMLCPRGVWTDPVYHSSYHSLDKLACVNCSSSQVTVEESTTLKSDDEPPSRQQQDLCSCPVCRLTNEDKRDYLEPTPVAPGEGLPGALWADDRSREYRKSKVDWRDIKGLAADPDRPWNPRLQHMAAMGLGWAAAIPIWNEGQRKGIVIYMTRVGVDLEKVKDSANEVYLDSATRLITAALVVRVHRHQARQQRRREARDAWRRVRLRIKAAKAFRLSLEDLVRKNSDQQNSGKEEEESCGHVTPDCHPIKDTSEKPSGWLHFLMLRFYRLVHVVRDGLISIPKIIGMTLTKCAGANVKPPPPATWEQSFHSFLASLAGMLLITANRNWISKDLGTFGALLALLFCLPAAPAAQPPNVLIGEVLSVSVAIILGYIPESFWTSETKISVTTAFSVGLMSKLGVPNPPATGSAVFFAENAELGWRNLAWFLVGDLIVVIVAALLNNLSTKRQYPSYWGIGIMIENVKAALLPNKKEQ